MTSPDVAWGAFTDVGPWTVVPSDLSWRDGIDELRARTRLEAPALTRAGVLPPLGRVARTGVRFGAALGQWTVLDRLGGAEGATAALSARLRSAFESLGPTYVKLGQIVSTGSGVFPPDMVAEFAHCRDDVPPESFRSVRRTIERELGGPVDETFESIDERPLAAGSVAQVYAARLHSGQDVVVKVLRRGIGALVRDDLATMAWMVRHVVGRLRVARLANPKAVLEVFAETILEELDLRLEADNMLDVARALGESVDRRVLVPRPHPELVTRRVLVMERMEGFAFDDASSVRAAAITPELLRGAVVSFVEAVFAHGVFHGDLHGGNLRIRPDGRIALLDHGITGRFDDTGRRAFTRLLLTAAMGDLSGQLEAVRDLGALPPDTDLDALAVDLGLDVGLPDVADLDQRELADHLQALAASLLDHGARLPKAVVLLVKDVLFLDSAIALHAPEIDLFAEAVAVLEDLIASRGDELAVELGVAPDALQVDLAGLRHMFGLSDMEQLPYEELCRRRDLLRDRLTSRP
ncbi:MAG: AarF/UbiB family protein [Acidimicrobiales bacterium]|nr:AarF/UbiB family protein [Acidimicrobiales bacterium]